MGGVQVTGLVQGQWQEATEELPGSSRHILQPRVWEARGHCAGAGLPERRPSDPRKALSRLLSWGEAG